MCSSDLEPVRRASGAPGRTPVRPPAPGGHRNDAVSMPERGDVTETTSPVQPEALERVVIRFAGDSGDGMQLVGDRFTDVSAAFGNDLATLPNYPAEIRAPAGTVAGVSSFQVHISSTDIVTPGDAPNVLIAMNPAALRANLGDLVPGTTLLVNADTFEQRSLEIGRAHV